MSLRALLAVGCNTYDHLPRLNGAESDAKRIYEELTNPNIGNYSAAYSVLLLSPTTAQLKDAIEQILFSRGTIDTFTFFFAGHGDVQPTGFYMCLRDTRGGRSSTSGFWLSELFGSIAAAGPAQTNVILDACYSGGLTADLTTLTKSEILGDEGTPAITLLAMAARNQESFEEDAGGFGTNALLDCISGRTFVHDSKSALDLYSIGLAVTERAKRELQQNPCLWALNTTRASIFCRNPHYQATAESAFKKWRPRDFVDAVEPVLTSHSQNPKELIADVERLTGGLLDRARSSDDQFREIEVRTTATISLLPYCGTWSAIDAYVVEQVELICDSVRHALRKTNDCMSKDKFALLTRRGGMGELYALPLRISKLIGWSGAAYHLARLISRSELFQKEEFKLLLAKLTEEYPLSVATMSDLQAPFIALGLTAAHQLALHDEGETILSLLFSSVVAVKGMLATSELEGGKVLQYLLARQLEDFSNTLSLVARPSEVITVLLRLAPLFGLADTFDNDLEVLDHVNINAYFPEDYQCFAAPRIEGGENATFTIGHGVWTCGDLDSAWPYDLTKPPVNTAMACGAILASLVFPDRAPWFIFPQRSEYPQDLARSTEESASEK